MISVVLFLDDTVSNAMSLRTGAIENVLDRWIFNLRNLGATHLFVVDRTRFHILQYFQNTDSGVHFGAFNSLEEIEQAYPDAQFVYLENDKSLTEIGVVGTPLPQFQHPEDVVYVFGGDFGPKITPGRKEKTWVTIPGVDNLWTDAAAYITVFDNLVKR